MAPGGPRFQSTGPEGRQLRQDIIDGKFGEDLNKPAYMRVYNMEGRPYQRWTKDTFRNHARGMIRDYLTSREHQTAVGMMHGGRKNVVVAVW